MTITLIIISCIAGLAIGVAVAIVLRSRHSDDSSKRDEEIIKRNTENFLALARQQLESQKSEIRVDLEGKKSAITDLINEIRKDIKVNEERVSQSDNDRVRSFVALKNELETYKQITGELKGSTDQLRNLLSNNQLRGQFGEQVAENLLKMAGFVVGQDYTVNQTQDTVDTRPDFTIILPDKTKINVDAKFPYHSLVQYVENEKDKDLQHKYLKQFQHDVKEKIRQVTSRDYINPQENTVDFVILFIPNEMIFSFIYDRFNETWEEAMRKKVILAGPFSFTAILRMVKQAHTNFSYQANLQNIIGLIHKFDDEYRKYCEEVDKLGIRIDSVSKQYHSVSDTRHRKLTTVVDKIKTQKAIQETQEQTPLLEQ